MNNNLYTKIIAIIVLLFISSSALALNVDIPLSDATQEARAVALFHEIRCVVCVSEAIADSPAEVAGDMRRDIRSKITDGASDEDIKNLLVSQYGDVILMKPPLNASTVFLWFGPWIIVVMGLFFVIYFFRKNNIQGK